MIDHIGETTLDGGQELAWKWLLLGQLCRTTSGGTPSRKRTDYFEGTIPWVKSGELLDGPVFSVEEFITEEALANSSAKVFPTGTLLIALYGATVGRLGILTRDAATNQAVCAVFTPKELNTRFLFWYLRFRRADLIAQAVGGAQPNISQSILRSLNIPVPPIDQQRGIVDEIENQLSRLDEAVGNLRRVKVNLKRYKAAVLKSAVEGQLVSTEAELSSLEARNYETSEQLLEEVLQMRRAQWKGRGRYKEPAAPDTSDLPDLPSGWKWATIDQVGDVQLGKMLDRQKHVRGNKLPYLRNINIRWGFVDTSDLLEMYFEGNELQRFGLRIGDVLVCEGGEPGRSAVWTGHHAEMKYQKALHRVRLSKGLLPRLLVYLLEYLATTGRLERWFTGSTIKHFTREAFLHLPVPLPPLPEQHRIVAEIDRRLSSVHEVEAEIDSNLNHAQALRHVVLAHAFRAEGKYA